MKCFATTIISRLLFSLCLAAPSQVLFAHGDLHEAIARVGSRIEKDPQDVFLYFERGMLYQEHEELEAALADYEQVLALEPDFYSCLLQMAQIHLLRNRSFLALSKIEEYLNREPASPFAYKTRAEIWQRLGEHRPAVADLRTMIALKNENAIRPEDYFQLSDGILRADPGNYREAIGALEEGMDRLGTVVSLQSRTVDLEVLGGRYDDALARIDRILETLAIKRNWRQKKAEILTLAGRPEEAARVLEQVRAETEKPGRTGQVQWAQKPLTATKDAPPLGRLSAQTVIRGPYLQCGSPQSMTVKWRTDGPTNSKIWFGTDLAHLDQSLAIAGSWTDHEVTLTGLTPNTKYYYAIGDDAGYLAGGDSGHFFSTSPMPGAKQPVRAWVLGDCGTGDERARAVRDGYYAYADTNFTDLILLLGDNAYDDGTDAEYQRAMFENMYEDQLIHSVLWPTPGNHDYRSADAASQTGPYYDIFTVPKQGEAGGLASGTEAYYSFDYANIHFISLDSHDSGRNPGDPMLVWLENDLNATGQDWIVVFFHHPPYSKGSHDSDKEDKLIEMRENVLPILEAKGVDLVLSGHSHSYERSFYLHGHYGRSSTLQPEMIIDDGDGRMDGQGAYQKYLHMPQTSKGQVYITAGSSGKLSNGKLNHPIMYYNAMTLGSLSLEVTDLQLDLKFIGAQGEVLDYFTIRKATLVGAPPAVSVTFPFPEAFVPTPQSIPLEADASDPEGAVRQVSFFVDGAFVGVDSVAPYAIDWTIPSSGRFMLEATAQDGDGNIARSERRYLNVGSISVCSQINQDNDDAEERTNGRVDLTSSDLEMCDDQSVGKQLIGMRFTGLNIPQGALIQKAYLQFTSDDDNNENPCVLNIHAQAADDAADFSSAGFDLSSRPRTLGSVSWSPADWTNIGEAGPAQRSPDLSVVVQEVVDREGFTSSSALVFLVSGTGRRTAFSYNGDAAAAPRLCVEFSMPCSLPENLFSSAPDPVCGVQDVTLSAGPAAGYHWNTGDTTSEISARLFQSAPFSLLAWDENGCLKTDTMVVAVHPAPEIDIAGDTAFCPGGQTRLFLPQAFVLYQWTGGIATDTLPIEEPGVYKLTVTDENGCTATDSTTVRVFEPVQARISGDTTLCAGEETTLMLTNTFARYLWTGNIETAGLSVNAPGVYKVTAIDENGCASEDSTTVRMFEPSEAAIIGDTLLCRDTQGKLFLTKSFAGYQWTGDVGTDTLFVNAPGVYGVTATDANGCTAIDTITVRMYDSPEARIGGDTMFCEGEQGVLALTESFASYLWTGGVEAPTLIVDQPGVYGVSVADEYGCSFASSIEVRFFEAVEARIGGDDAFCEGAQGRLFLASPFIRYQWTTGAATDTLLVDTPGVYGVTVTDENGCTAEAQTEVAELPKPTFSFEADTVFICRGEVAEILGPEDFSAYGWSTGEISRSVVVDQSIHLSLVVKDANGCSASDTIAIIERPVPEVFLELEGDILKNSISLEPPGGYQYLWSTGDTTTTLLITASGEYCLTVANSFGCAGEDCIELVINSEDSTVQLFPWRAYPNPFRDHLEIGPIDRRHKLEVLVFDLVGRSVPIRVETEKERIVVWLGDLPSGVYLVAVKDGLVRRVAKVIKL